MEILFRMCFQITMLIKQNKIMIYYITSNG